MEQRYMIVAYGKQNMTIRESWENSRIISEKPFVWVFDVKAGFGLTKHEADVWLDYYKEKWWFKTAIRKYNPTPEEREQDKQNNLEGYNYLVGHGNYEPF